MRELLSLEIKYLIPEVKGSDVSNNGNHVYKLGEKEQTGKSNRGPNQSLANLKTIWSTYRPFNLVSCA